MKFIQESIFHSTIRALFTKFFGMIGLGLGIITIIAGLIMLAPHEESFITTRPKILPNANGNRLTLRSKSPVILNIDIQDVIGGNDLTSQKIESKLLDSREGIFAKDRVKAIFLKINSPGGSAWESDTIYHLIKDYKEKYNIPVYAYVDGICASGALYIACAADKIYANDVSLIGSVGTISGPFFNLNQLMSKVGIDSKTVSSGKDKDAMNPFRPWKADESQSMQDISDNFYKIFVNIVANARPKLDKEKLINEYGANVYFANEAQKLGFIDAAGYSRNQALQQLADDAGIKGQKYVVVNLSSHSWIADLFESKVSKNHPTVKHKLHIGPDIADGLANQYLYMYKPAQ